MKRYLLIIIAFLGIGVSAADRGPVWADSYLSFGAITTKLTHQQLSRYVIAPFGTPLTFTKKSGPDWLSVSADGLASGMPTNGDLGPNTFLVDVTDGQTTSEVRLEIEVELFVPSEE